MVYNYNKLIQLVSVQAVIVVGNMGVTRRWCMKF